MTLDTVVFDLGNVLIGWDPRRLYSRLTDDQAELALFLGSVCTPAWHDLQDRGGSCADATRRLATAHPEHREWIEAFYGRWWEMFEPMPASVDVLESLHSQGVRLLALTNWPREMFVEARGRYPFLRHFEAIVVSGEEGIAKPDREIFERLLHRHDIDPRQAFYVDDNPQHVATANSLGMSAHQYVTVTQLRRDLAAARFVIDATVDVRPGDEADLPALTRIYNHYVTDTPATFDLDPFSEQVRRGWLDHYAPLGRHRLLVATQNHEVVGYATSGSFRAKPAYDPTVEVTVYLAPEAGGRGIGSMLYQELFAQLRDEDVHRAVAAVALPNEASVALHHRFGFTDVGTLTEVGHKFDKWWDVLWLQRPMP